MLNYLAVNLKTHIGSLINSATEIRVRLGRPLTLRFFAQEVGVYMGKVCPLEAAYIASERDIAETLDRITEASLYAFREQFKQGFLMLPGGHRVGITGEVSLAESGVYMQRHISSLNIRLAKDVPGAAAFLYPHLSCGPKHTVVVGPREAARPRYSEIWSGSFRPAALRWDLSMKGERSPLRIKGCPVLPSDTP